MVFVIIIQTHSFASPDSEECVEPSIRVELMLALSAAGSKNRGKSKRKMNRDSGALVADVVRLSLAIDKSLASLRTCPDPAEAAVSPPSQPRVAVAEQAAEQHHRCRN